jgi:hypothetical protein
MLKKLSSLLLAATVVSLVACSPTATPNAATDGTGSTTSDGSTSANADITVGSITKAQYLTLLDCYATKSGASAEAKVGLESIKASVNAIPDAQWNLIAAANPGFSTQLKLAVQSGCAI